MKKFLAFVLALGLMTATLASCGGDSGDANATTSRTTTTSTTAESVEQDTTTAEITTTQAEATTAEDSGDDTPDTPSPTSKRKTTTVSTTKVPTTVKATTTITKTNAPATTTTKQATTTTATEKPTTTTTTTTTTVHSTSEPTTATTTTTTVTVPTTTTTTTTTEPTTTTTTTEPTTTTTTTEPTTTTTTTEPTTTTTTTTTTQGTDYTEKTVTIAEVMDKVKIQGRYIPVDTGISLDWTGSTLEFNADCEGTVSVKVDTTLMGTTDDDRYFTVSVDGVHNPERIKIPQKTEATIVLAENLERGSHSFALIHETEWAGSATVKTITLSGQLTNPPENKKLVEFVGDSITCGYGNLGNSSTPGHAGRAELQSATKSYGYLTAQALNVDASYFAMSGYGLVKGYGQGAILPFLYNQASYVRGLHKWDFKTTADVVVVNLGTNDYDRGADPDEFEQGVYDFIEKIQNYNPGCKIVWASGMMNSAFLSLAKTAIADLGGADAGYYVCELPLGGTGAGTHPSEAEHKAAANVLTKFFQDNNILG